MITSKKGDHKREPYYAQGFEGQAGGSQLLKGKGCVYAKIVVGALCRTIVRANIIDGVMTQDVIRLLLQQNPDITLHVYKNFCTITPLILTQRN